MNIYRRNKNLSRSVFSGAFNGPRYGVRMGVAVKWFDIRNADTEDGPVEILIYDQIGKDWWTGEGTEAKAFVEELKKIHKDREILVRINSPGGNVHDGMAIYNRLAERRDKVTCVVDGVAASIASVIALCGKTLEMPRNSLMMIHDPWGFVQGSADDMRQAATMLDVHRDAIVSVYERKTGAAPAKIKQWMKDETWYTGDEAKECGFCDTVKDEISFQACFDYSKFERVPKQLQQKQNKTEDHMDRTKIIAKLKKLGVAFDESATDEQLQALLVEAMAAANATKAAPKKKLVAIPAGTGEEASEESEEESEPEDEAPPSPTRRGTRPAAATFEPDPEVATMRGELNRVNAHLEKERKQRIEGEVDRCIAQDRLPGAQRDKWVKRALADESVLDDLRVMPPRPPGTQPLDLVIVGEAPRDIANGIIKLREPLANWLKGNDVSMDTISASARQIAIEIEKHRKALGSVLNANTIDPALKRNVILSDFMRAFKRRITLLNAFSTKFNNVPLQGTNKVTVPFYDLDTTASKNFLCATGYLFDEDTTVGFREVTVDKRKYKSMNFQSEVLRRIPYFQPEVAMMLKAEQLALDVWLDVLSIVTAANYGVPVKNVEAGSFDSDDMIDLRNIANKADWPDVGRAAVLSSDHDAALLADDAVKLYMNSNSDQALREGATGRLLGFEMFYSPRIPTNSEDLAGFIALPPAIIVATSPIAPAPGVRAQLLSYEVVIDPSTGIAFEYRYGADTWMDADREVVECNYGYAKGNSAALKRITAGSSEYSSSSSASSVNSSSSSSSSPSF